MLCRAPAVPRPCHVARIGTRRATTLPCFDCAVSFVKVRVVAGKIRTVNPTVLLIARVAAGRSRTWAGRPQSVERRPMIIHTFHAVPLPCCVLEKFLSERHGRRTARARHWMSEMAFSRFFLRIRKG